MGAFNSINRPDSPAPSSPTDPVSMSDPAPQTQSEEPQSDAKPSSPEQPPSAAESDATQPEIGDEEEDEDEDEERAECGFCVFMKGGGCKESFVAWENCVEEAENNYEDIAQKCFELTSALKDCMLAHPDYYEPILRAEKASEEQAVQELDREKQREGEGSEEGVAEVEESSKAEEEVAVVAESSKAGDGESAGGKE